MAKSDIAVKNWISTKERFADLFNAYMFGGRQVVKPEELKPAEGEADIIVKDKDGQERSFQRYRDVVMRWKGEVNLVILALENQDKIHYGMPVRVMVYDGLTYTEQMRRMWEECQKKGEKCTEEEFLSRFRKDDRLRPVLTVVFYYGEKPWDASRDIHQMLELDNEIAGVELMKKYIPNYHINVIDAARIENMEAFKSDLQLILGMLQYRNKREELVRYVNLHKEYFGSLDRETYYAVQAFLNSKKQLMSVVSEQEEREGVDMCKALEDLYNDGVENGKNSRNQELILRKYEKGMSVNVIADFLEMAVEEVERVICQGTQMNK